MKSNATFYFSGQDSLSQFMVWLPILGAACLPIPFLVWRFGGTTAAIASVAIALVALAGLRASIAVSPSGVVITKSWFFIPYWRYRGPAIEDVWFGGDWGESEGASGVVVKLKGKEIHFGSRKSMHQLHAALFPLRVGHVADDLRSPNYHAAAADDAGVRGVVWMNALELRVPPPVLALCLALLMWFASSLVPPVVVPFGVRVGMALALVAIGQSIGISGIRSFRRAKTTINPVKPSAASSLVTSGVYRYTRNPMYLGLLVTLMGWAVFLSNALALLAVPLFVLYINRFQINPEERVLSSLFGAEYVAYKEKVRRWL